MQWTEDQLAKLPVSDGVRQRGVDMTRLETFCDAAFAFSVTLLVVAGDGIPNSYGELVLALKGIPAFAASFTAIAAIWWAHRTWSRRFGLEDSMTTVISLAMVMVILIYVYPLKMVFSAFASWASVGFLPTDFVMTDPRDMLGIFLVYGLGFGTLTAMLAALNLRALKASDRLLLNEVERIRTRQQIALNSVLGVTGVASALFAVLMPANVAIFAGFLYMTLAATMPLMANRYEKQVAAVEKAEEEIEAG